MKQATVKLPSGEYVLAEIAGWDKYHNPIYDNILFPGSWQLLGADPTRLTEEEAGEIVESWPSAWGDGVLVYQNYPDEIPKCRTTLASLDSLAASLGIEKPFVVLKNIEKMKYPKDANGRTVKVGDKVRGEGFLTFKNGFTVDRTPIVTVRESKGVLYFGGLRSTSFPKFWIVNSQ